MLLVLIPIGMEGLVDIWLLLQEKTCTYIYRIRLTASLEAGTM
jgi:hypothetical protein